ncbi:hypothetical protein [Streptomyces sp. NPDC092307]|uniref:hypothetical protein n=1 Tax=Streptomyces sp. NPDC092307 TaxID=3366013 RepID=UPI0037F581A0
MANAAGRSAVPAAAGHLVHCGCGGRTAEREEVEGGGVAVVVVRSAPQLGQHDLGRLGRGQRGHDAGLRAVVRESAVLGQAMQGGQGPQVTRPGEGERERLDLVVGGTGEAAEPALGGGGDLIGMRGRL